MKEIILGNGTFYIGEDAIGLTRGGGQFVIEKEYRDIVADGDRGRVKGRTKQDRSSPKLTINQLEIVPENLPKMYAAVKATKGDGKTTITGKGNIDIADYQDVVKFVGETKSGREVVIKVLNAINLENFDWTLADKDEVIAALTYEGCYLENSPKDFEPWEVEFADE